MVHLEVSHWFLLSYRVDFNPPLADWTARRDESFGGGATWLGWNKIQKNPEKKQESVVPANLRQVQDGSMVQVYQQFLDWNFTCVSFFGGCECELPAPTSKGAPSRSSAGEQLLDVLTRLKEEGLGV